MNKIIFVPYITPNPQSSERTPKLIHILSGWTEILPVSTDELDNRVYDQNYNKFQRYGLFILSELKTFFNILKIGRKNRDSIIFAEGSYYASAGAMASKILQIPSVWDNHGNIKDFGAAVGKSNAFIKSNLMMEKIVARAASKIIVVSEKDEDVYKKSGFDRSKFIVIPTCADLSMVTITPKSEAKSKLGIPADKKVILFFGSLNYYPNEDAVRYLIDNAIPDLRKLIPDATLYVAGSGTIENTDDAVMLGYVPDIFLWISAADVCVAPLWKGVGILTKVIDVLSVGCPIVVSSLAVDGIPELVDGKNCLIGTKDNFHEKIAQILCNPELGNTLGNEGRKLILDKYSWEAVAPKLKSCLEAL